MVVVLGWVVDRWLIVYVLIVVGQVTGRISVWQVVDKVVVIYGELLTGGCRLWRVSDRLL